jgi:hypothetical protein
VLRASFLFLVASLSACSRSADPLAGSLTIRVSADALQCTVHDVELPCTDLASHLKNLKLKSSTLIVLSDEMTGRTDDALAGLSKSLRKDGYKHVAEIGFLTQPEPK